MSIDNHLMTLTKDVTGPDSKFGLLAQVPSMEEMKNEVANITCQMQSVYIGEDSPVLSRPLVRNSVADDQTVIYSDKADLENDPPMSDLKRKFNTLGGHFQTLPRSSNHDERRSLLRSNTIDKMNELSSSSPREEQLCEEFDIDGRRFRQLYKRRVTLERKTSREVIFLPASSMDSRSDSNPKNASEFISPSSSQCEHSNQNIPNSELSPRPLLDLSVVHCPPRPNHESCCITPTVVLHTAPNRSWDASESALEASSLANPPKTRRLSWSVNAGYPWSKFSHQAQVSTNSATLTASQRNSPRRLMRDLFEYTKKRLKVNRGTEISMHSRPQANNDDELKSSFLDELQTGSLAIVGCDPASKGVQHWRSSQLCETVFGYMYQFGVWDDQSPVLDPRLPVINEATERTGTIVMAKRPEWHHAEVGLDSNSATTGSQEPLVRGRIVACLQRFTQHSAVTGKLLHRSTYVQQTRLVRQRNKQDTSKNTDDLATKTSGDCSESTGTLGVALTLDPMLPMNSVEHIKTCGQASTNLGSGTRNSASLDLNGHTEEPQRLRCSAERLQLLQSICPSAAAATSLLGRQFITDRISDSDTELDEVRVKAGPNGFDYPLVTATSWCPPALSTRDLSPYLLLQHKNTEPPSSPKSAKVKRSTTDLPQPPIRGGTLDGLVAYTLQSLERKSTVSRWENLFHHVFLVTYPTFTTSERVIEKLIQFYVAWAPVEPGYLSTDWDDALLAADFLVTVAMELHPDQLTTRMVLRLARFARLLILDGLEWAEHRTANEGAPHNQTIATQPVSKSKPYCFEHKTLADHLFENLPLVSATAQLRERMGSSTNTALGGARRKCVLSRAESVKPRKTSCPRSSGRSSPQLRRRTTDTNSNSSSDNESQNEEHSNLNCALKRTDQFIRCDSQLLANEITRMEEEVFAQINLQEFLDIRRLERGESPTLGRCVEHFNRTTSWARSLLFVLGPALGQKLSAKSTTRQSVRISLERNQGTVGRKNSNLLGQNQSSCHKHGTSDTENSQQNYQQSNDHPLFTSKFHVPGQSVDQKLVNPDEIRATVARMSAAELKFLRMQHLRYVNIVFEKLCEILKHLKTLKNFSSFLALLLAVQQVPESVLSKRSKMMVSKYSSYMKPPMFTEYRRDLEASSLPCLPYLGLIFQQLIHLHAGNSVYLEHQPEERSVEDPPDDVDRLMTKTAGCISSKRLTSEQMINVWRCWKHYLILGYFLKRKENPEQNLHHISCTKEVQSIINGFRDTFPEALLEKAKEQLVHKMKVKRTQTTRNTY